MSRRTQGSSVCRSQAKVVMLLIRPFIAFALAFIALAARPLAANPVLVHHQVATRDQTAQREFDVGLTLIYAFNPEEATFHFQEAARHDPKLAMAYWGISLAAGPNINTGYDLRRAEIGREAAAVGLQLAGNVPSEAHDLLAAVRARYAVTNQASVLAAQRAYADAMKTVVVRYPADLDARTLYAESLMDLTPLQMWRADGAPNTYTHEVIDALDAVLAKNPAHVGAIHYLIHAYEASKTPAKALGAARMLARLDLPPGAEHLAHMPAHIFTRVGDYDEAIAASRKALAMFGTLLHEEHSDVHNGYYHHDYQVLDYAYMMSGQWANAHAAAQAIANQVQDNAAGVETYLRFHKWTDMLALAPPSDPDIRWRFALAMAKAGTGDLAAARALLATMSDRDRDPLTRLAHAQVAALIAATDHHPDVAIAELRTAVRIQDALPSKEPPAWYYPVRETLGARLALAGQTREAQRVFADDLRINPNNPRSLFGLATVLHASDPARAARVMADFKRAWQHADVNLTLADL